jgi:hypothetical protein
MTAVDFGFCSQLREVLKTRHDYWAVVLNLQSLAGPYDVYKHGESASTDHDAIFLIVEVQSLGLQLRMKHESIFHPLGADSALQCWSGTLCFTVTPTSAFKHSTFKEPDEFRRPDLELPIRQVFYDLRRDLPLDIYVGVRHPVTYTHHIRHLNQMSSDFGATTSGYCDNPAANVIVTALALQLPDISLS